MTRLSLALSGILLATAFVSAQNAGRAGAFARLGFGARGIGMGNAMTAVTSGDIATYYNPALSAFSDRRTASATFGILSFDRSLNFLSYTQSIKPTAGLSFGLINAGVSNIDGRDGDGVHTEDYSTFENQFYLAFSNRVSDRVALGAAIKLYYSKLFEEVKSSTVGFDIGICVKATDALTIGAAVIDFNSKYKWDTKSVYGVNGRPTEDKFPTLRKLAVSYTFPGAGALVTAEIENSSEQTTLFRFGAEYPVMENFSVRGGLDRLDAGSDATGAKPTFGFSVRNSFNGWTPSLNYAFVVESFAPHGMHIITLTAAL
jgi:hypothetical protein